MGNHDEKPKGHPKREYVVPRVQHLRMNVGEELMNSLETLEKHGRTPEEAEIVDTASGSAMSKDLPER